MLLSELASTRPDRSNRHIPEGESVPVDHNPTILALHSPAALVTTATSQPALRTGFAMLGLVSLLDLPKADRADRMVALGGAAAAGWFLVRGSHRR
jgi:hypothetical protein